MKKVIVLLLCALLSLSGCANTKIEDTNRQANYVEYEAEKIIYTSKNEKEECALCKQAGETLFQTLQDRRMKELSRYE